MRHALLAFALLAGCTCQSIEGYPPLNEICERAKLPFGSNTSFTTVGTNVYTTDLEDFNRRYPVGSVQYEALMRHEQVHARRQFDYQDLPGEMALWTWVSRYLSDARFMWREEQLAYYEEIVFLQIRGYWNSQSTFDQAKALSDMYKTASGEKMITFSEAATWINKVLAGDWKPQSK